MKTGRVVALAAGVLVVGAVVAIGIVLLRDDPQTNVKVERGDGVAAVGSLNRSDDAGADTLRAYLQAALSCTPSGARVMEQLSRSGERAVREIFASHCARSGQRPWTDALSGRLDPDQLDWESRARWAVSADDGSLPRGLHIRIRMEGGRWEIDRPCAGPCSNPLIVD